MSAVSVDSVTRAFGSTVALDAVSLDVSAGELFGVIGPDGAGKTTLFRILATLLLPDSGSATVLGRDVIDGMWEIRSRLGYMPGNFSLYPDLTVAENLAFFAAVFGTTVGAGRGLIAPIYDQIAPFSNRRADALSGGMKQKLALSCALVHRPELLLLDEPTTGVDAVSRREFWDQLSLLRDSGLTIIVSTPYMDEALRCDRVALIQGGRILGVDAPASLGNRFTHPLVGVRLRDRHRGLGVLRRFPNAHSVYPFGDLLHYADGRAGADGDSVARELMQALRDAGFPDATAESIEPGIEDVFMELMTQAAVE